MTRRPLPPLQVGDIYRVADFDYFEFTAESLQKQVTGEDFAILRLFLQNKTVLEVPTSTEKLHHLLTNLMAAYPQVAIDFAKQRKWLQNAE